MKHARSASSAVNLIATLLATTALVIPPSFASEILPQNGSVVSGNVTVQSSDGAMTVTQGSDKAIVNWQSFSVGQNNSVTFVQPGSSSAILNRVTGEATSTLAGSIHANGQVYLINPNGIAITPTGTIDVGGGFVASTLDMSDEDFLSGKALFEGDGSSASVTNDGVITIGRGGYAALMGGTVKNNGLISVPLGKVGLGSGEQITLDLSGDGFMQVALPTKDGAEGDGALIENSGTVSANGGTAVMKAATAREAARKAVNLSGVVEAKSVSGRNGAIVIGGGRGGSVKIAGKVKSRSSTGKGGSIKVSAAKIDLVGADIDASGAHGGGTVLIGGKKYGADGMQTAARTSVDADTIIRADATQDGNGGQVVVWSDELTTFAGTITARGMRNGDGGDTEVSGKQTLAYTGLVDLSAETGAFGTLLLDPYNLTITSDIGAGTSLVANGDDSTLSVATLVTALSTANVTVSTGSGGTQDGDITVADDVTWSENTVLTLDAANDIIFNADVTATGEQAGLALKYGGDYSFNSGASLTLSGANASLSMNDQAYTLIHSMSDLDAIDSTGLHRSYALAQDLDASGTTYTTAVVGVNYSLHFRGEFTGLGNTISNLTIEAPSNYYVGLFGVNTGTVRDINIENGSVTGDTQAGLLVGVNRDGAKVLNSAVTGTLNVHSYSGGLVGYNSGAIDNSSSSVTVTGSATATGTGVFPGSFIGGLVGSTSINSTIKNSQATGDVSGVSHAGGLVGDNYGMISLSHATGTVTGTTNYVGGLVGYNNFYGNIISSYATGKVTGTDKVGGLAGANNNNSIITSSYAVGDVNGQNEVGGLVGYNANKVISSFWDVETTGQTIGIGRAHANASTDATGLTSEDMKDPFSFIDAGWDFEKVWGKSTNSNSYMLLRSLSNEFYGGYVKLKNASMVYGGDTPDASDLFTSDSIGTDNAKIVWSDSLSTADVGDYAYRDVLTLSQVAGKKVYLAAMDGTLTITPAPRTVNQPVTVPTAGMFFNNPSVGTASLDTPSVRLSAPATVHQNQGGGDTEADGSDNSDGSQTSPFANVVVSEFSDGSDGSQPQEAIVTEDPQLSGTLCFAGSNFATYCASN